MIPSLNRDGDILSDLVLPLFGSIAGAESLLVAFADDDPTQVTAVMAEAAHGTAPALQGKNVANPMAMILAAAALLGHAGEEGNRRRARSARLPSRRWPKASAPPTSAATRGRPSSRTR